MFSFIRGRASSEHFSTAFHWFENRVFADSETPSYRASRLKGAYQLAITKPSYFAWEMAFPSREYADFVLDARVEADPANKHSAAGFVLRHVDDENFYTFLVSDRGLYRFDLLFNKHPVTLIPWTSLPTAPEPTTTEMAVRVIAHGSHFSFYVDEEWAGEIEDESLGSGGIGFAAQSYAETPLAVFRLRGFALEARPVEVEREYLRWVHYVPHSPASRLALAETLFASQNYSAAAIQLKRGLKGRDGVAREHFLLAECYARLSLLDGASQEIEQVLRLDPMHKEALFEKANLFYLRNEFLKARDYIRAGITAGTLTPHPVLWNLLGNVEYTLGNWDKSVEAYLRAVEGQGDEPLFLKNAAHALEMASRKPEALEMYLQAARLFFRGQAYDELSLILPRVKAIDPANMEAQALEAKVLYHEGRLDEALQRLTSLVGADCRDSSVSYLLGIVLTEVGRREEALPHLSRAAELEPDFALYHFRLAESLHLLGRNPTEELERAKVLDPDDPWVNNLAGVLALEAGNAEQAVALLRAALERAPEELDIRVNLSEALAGAGDMAGAMSLLSEPGADPIGQARLSNQKGNILVRTKDFAAAVSEYETAVRLDPEELTYRENCAAACLEVDMVHRAEELLAAVEEQNPSPSVYNLLGNAAALKGEYARAELAYTSGLSLDPRNADLTTNLAALKLERGRHQDAKALLARVLADKPGHARAEALLRRLRTRYEDRLVCSQCGREWWVAKDIPPQPPLVFRGDPPPDAPAGRCPRCGKLYCVGCASAHLADGRFHCADCGEALKLSDHALRYLLAELTDQSLTKPV